MEDSRGGVSAGEGGTNFFPPTKTLKTSNWRQYWSKMQPWLIVGRLRLCQKFKRTGERGFIPMERLMMKMKTGIRSPERDPRMTFLTPTVLKGDSGGAQVVAHELAHS